MRIGALVIVVSTLMYAPESVLESAKAGHRMPMLNAMVPGLPIEVEDGWLNYWLVYAFHSALVFLGGIGTCAADMFLVMLVMHMLPLAELFQLQVHDLNVVLALPVAARNKHEFRFFFRNIVQMHKEITDFLRQLSKIYYYVYFIEINADSMSLCVLIVCVIQIEWMGMYPLILLFTFKLFAYCFLGTIAELGSDRIYAALLSCDWYELPQEQKLQYLLMLLAAQRPSVLMAGTVPLNLDTFVNVRMRLVP